MTATADLPQTEPRSVHANGIDIHYLEAGEGEPLVLLHGAWFRPTRSGRAFPSRTPRRWRHCRHVFESSRPTTAAPGGPFTPAAL